MLICVFFLNLNVNFQMCFSKKENSTVLNFSFLLFFFMLLFVTTELGMNETKIDNHTDRQTNWHNLTGINEKIY